MSATCESTATRPEATPSLSSRLRKMRSNPRAFQNSDKEPRTQKPEYLENETEAGAPATRRDLQAAETRLTARMRTMQAELLRGFAEVLERRRIENEKRSQI